MTFQNMYTLAPLLIFSHLVYGSSVSLSSPLGVLEDFFLLCISFRIPNLTLNNSRERLLAIKDIKEPSGSHTCWRFTGVQNATLVSVSHTNKEFFSQDKIPLPSPCYR